MAKKKIVRLLHISLFSLLIIFIGCKQESNPEATNSDIVYEPFGKNIIANEVTNKDDNTLLIVHDVYTLSQYSGKPLANDWECNFDYPIADYTASKNGNVFAIEDNYADPNIGDFANELFVYLINSKGEKSYADELLPNEHTLSTNVIDAVSDGENGFWALIYLQNGTNPPSIQRRFLVHVNNLGKVDQRTEIFGFYVYLDSDEKGNIYLSKTVGPEGTTMLLNVGKVDMVNLKTNKTVSFLWNYQFKSLEPDFKWTNYTPFDLSASNQMFHIIKQHNTGKNDISTGLDVIHLDFNTGTEISTYTIPFDFEVNNYNNQSTMFSLFNKGVDFIAFNFGKKSKSILSSTDGTIQSQRYMSGDNNRCTVTGCGYIGDEIYVFGVSTNNQSPSYIPFFNHFYRP